MKLEHDKWSNEISEILISHQPLMELNIAKVYHDFQEFSSYEMLMTNHELTKEGKKMRHCVGTYVGDVNSGKSCIFHVHGCTLELRYGNPYYGSAKNLCDELGVEKILYISQYQDYGNTRPKKDYYDSVSKKVEEFNRTVLSKGVEKDVKDAKAVEDVWGEIDNEEDDGFMGKMIEDDEEDENENIIPVKMINKEDF